MRHPLRWIAFWTYVLALFLPVFIGSDLKGYHVILIGVIAFVDLQWILGLPWLANLGFILAFRQHGGLPRTIVILVSLAMASLVWGIHFLPQEGTEELIGVSPDWGLRIWYAAFVILALDAILGGKAGIPRRSTQRQKKKDKQEAPREEVLES
ncbi:MAG: hypothetical protein K9I85_11275 [Saprospiraceae bacterium]|nr:hypothetical protein [Saprospiraceae bacterium]